MSKKKKMSERERIHRRNMNFIRDLIGVFLGIGVMVGIPYLFGEGWLVLSWIPALIVFALISGSYSLNV